MSPLLQIRDVPEETRRTLKARAAAQGKSLNSYLLDLIGRDVAQPTVREVLDRAARHAEMGEVSAVGVIAAGRSEREGQVPRSSGA